jgi:hypothetical protein
MADFCFDCAHRLGFPGSDIHADPGQTVWEICEGCGPSWFDEYGVRVEEHLSESAAPGGPQP